MSKPPTAQYAHEMVERLIHSAIPGVNAKGEHFIGFEVQAADYAVLMLTLGYGVGSLNDRDRAKATT